MTSNTSRTSSGTSSRASSWSKSRASKRSSRPEDDEDDTPAADAPRSGKITAIKPQQHDPERVSIFLDNNFAFGLHMDLVLEWGLHVGLELLEAQTEEILTADEVKKATSAALQLLSYRARSEGEIAARLRQRGFSDSAIAATIARLREWHYVDDSDFAALWVENRQQHRPRSTRMLAHELRAKGVAATTIEETIADAGVDEVSDARELVIRQRAKYEALPPEVQTRRITAFLARRGYACDVIRRALEQDDDADSGADSETETGDEDTW
ncbi:MAG: RecX family transcriptional regulator [Thermomicrobiales bacterium]